MYGWRNDAWREVIAADSRKKILDRRDSLLDAHGDNTEVVHKYEDGSTIRKLNGQGDHDFESDMQGNCVRDHTSDNNVHSLRDKDNVPILSFGLDTAPKEGYCPTCEGSGERYEADPETGDRNYIDCHTCGGTGSSDGKPDGVIRLNSVLRKENETPHDNELLKLVDGLKNHYASTADKPCPTCDSHPSYQGTYHSVEIDGGKTRTFGEIEGAKEKAKQAESLLPKGDVYLKIPEGQFHVDDEATLHDHGAGTLHPYGDSSVHSYDRGRPEVHEEDPGPSPGHYVVKTPYTPRRFKHDTGLSHFLNYDSDMKDKPDTWVGDESTFPKNAYSVVHKPNRPTKIWITTTPAARDNTHFYRPEGLGAGMIEGNVSTEEPGHVKSDGPNLPVTNVDHHDLWEVNFKDEDEARSFMKNNHPSNDLLHIPKEKTCPTCKGTGADMSTGTHQDCPTCKGVYKVQNTIPWDKVKLVRPANKEGIAPMPKMVANEDGSVGVKVQEPKTLYFQPKAYGDEGRNDSKRTWQELHDLENSHLSQEAWGKSTGYNDGLRSAKPSNRGGEWHSHEAPVTIGVPNDPKYVEEIPANERRDGNKDRQWRLKEGVKVPRSEYTLEHTMDHDLTPTHAYLHISHTKRDDPQVYNDKGIDVSRLQVAPGNGREASPDFKVTAEPNTEPPAHWNKHHPMSPSQADIFKVDLSKMPDWKLSSQRTDHRMGEHQSDAHVLRMTPPEDWGKETCENCDGVGSLHGDELDSDTKNDLGLDSEGKCIDCGGKGFKHTEPDQTIPWEGVTGLHSKAEVQPTEEYKKRFATLRLQGSLWGEVRARRVST